MPNIISLRIRWWILSDFENLGFMSSKYVACFYDFFEICLWIVYTFALYQYNLNFCSVLLCAAVYNINFVFIWPTYGIILDLFTAKNSPVSSENICNDSIRSKRDVQLQNLVTSFNSNDSIDHDYPNLNDMPVESPILSQGICHKYKLLSYSFFPRTNEFSYRI